MHGILSRPPSSKTGNRPISEALKTLAKAAILTVFLLSCKGQQFTTSSSQFLSGKNSITISWDANRERAVNQTGGGYRVYYSTNSGFSLDNANFVDVPYSTGPLAPTSAKVTDLPDATIYYKVVAYSSLIPPGGSTGAVSEASAEASVALP